MDDRHNGHGVKRPTEEAAIKRLSAGNERMRKILTVARLAIDLCLEDLGGR